MAPASFTRKLTAILNADVEGYSRLIQDDEETTIRTLTTYRGAMATLIQKYRGRVVDSPGDNLLAEFASVVDAVQCAVEIQRELAERNTNLPAENKMAFRIGVNLGDVVVEDGHIYGDGVNIAARLESLCEGGGVCISGAAFEHVENKLDVDFDDLGDHEFKNINKPVRVYRVLSSQAASAHRFIKAKKAAANTRPKVLVFTIGVLFAVAAVAGWLYYFRYPTIETASVEKMAYPLPDKPSIAVLPFHNLSGEPEQEYFSDGITDDLITDLSKISGLFVIANNSAFAYKGKPLKIRQVAEELGVRYVLEGSVRKADNRVRINAQLIDATTGRHLWAERYDRRYTDIFDLQDEVIGKIVSALTVKLTSGEQAQLARRPTDNLEAYDYYLRAERNIYSDDPSLFINTLSLYKKAIALDPNFAEAHAGYARAAVEVWRLGYNSLSAGPGLRKDAFEAADRALALNANIPRVYSVLGVLQVMDGRYDEAILSVHKAVSLGPNSADAYLNLAIVLMYSGIPSEALAAIETALRLNPKPSPGVYAYYGEVLVMNRYYDKAIKSLEKARASSFTARAYLAIAYSQLGRLDDAKVEVAGMLKRYPAMSLSFQRILYAHFKRGEDRALIFEALREAGMPEWPFGYKGHAENRLDGSALKTLAFGRTWAGHTGTGLRFMQEIGADGKMAYRNEQNFFTGNASVQGDMLCLQSAVLLLGRKHCGYVYRNPEGTLEENNAYVYVGTAFLLFFSPVR